MLFIRKRIVDSCKYESRDELIFKGGKTASIKNLKREIIARFNLNVKEDDIDLAKHCFTQFEWKEINLKTVVEYRESQIKVKNKKKSRNKRLDNVNKNTLLQVND